MNDDFEPLESHVSYLLGFALGFISGNKTPGKSSLSSMNEALQAYFFAGGKLDTQIGDIVLDADSSWYILEAKRSSNEFAKEYKKARVRRLKLAMKEKAHVDLARAGAEAHRFLYLSYTPEDVQPFQLKTLSYLKWLSYDSDDEDARQKFIDTKSLSLADFLIPPEMSGRLSGFSYEELEDYVKLMNADETASGASSTDVVNRLVAAIDASGKATIHGYEALCSAMKIDLKAGPSPSPNAAASSSSTPAKRKP